MTIQYIIIISIWIFSLAIYFYTFFKSKNEAEERLREKNRQLQRLYDDIHGLYEKEKDLIDMAGHEIRTPASIAKNHLHLLEKHLRNKHPKSKDEKTTKYLRRLEESIERQISIINTFLETTRIENNQFVLQKSPHNLIDIAERAVEDYRRVSEEKGLKLTFVKKESEIISDVDVVRIREVMDNLLENAIKYTQKGKVEVKALSKDNYFHFEVSDTGIGISKEDQKKIFQKFWRVDSNIGKGGDLLVKPGGTGLGLFVSKRIIDEHGGEIGVKSKKAGGSRFFFKLPLE